jgi:polyisoprenoid-binding protein YceI
MFRRFGIRALIGTAAVVALLVAPSTSLRAVEGVAVDSATITISGSSNIHAWTASTNTIRITRSEVVASQSEPDVWADALKPGGVAVFEVAIPAATLHSTKDGIDGNMHKALDVKAHPDITFTLTTLEPVQTGVVKATGTLQIAGVEREVSFSVKAQPRGMNLMVSGSTDILMTDYGIKPPKALLGMLKTNPKVTVSFELLMTSPLA